MLLNFSITNGLQCNPGLTCLKRTGRPSFRRTRTATTNINGPKTTRPMPEHTISKILFITFFYNRYRYRYRNRYRQRLPKTSISIANPISIWILLLASIRYFSSLLQTLCALCEIYFFLAKAPSPPSVFNIFICFLISSFYSTLCVPGDLCEMPCLFSSRPLTILVIPFFIKDSEKFKRKPSFKPVSLR